MEYEVYMPDEPQTFTPPKKMIVWSEKSNEVKIANVLYVNSHYRLVIAINNGIAEGYDYCAEPSLKFESRLATPKEFQRWLASGKGQYKGINGVIRTYFSYSEDMQKTALDNIIENALVRKWGDKNWHRATIDYLTIEPRETIKRNCLNCIYKHEIQPINMEQIKCFCKKTGHWLTCNLKDKFTCFIDEKEDGK